MKDFDNFTKFAENVGNLGKTIVATCFEKLPKSNKSTNLVTLVPKKKNGISILFKYAIMLLAPRR